MRGKRLDKSSVLWLVFTACFCLAVFTDAVAGEAAGMIVWLVLCVPAMVLLFRDMAT